MEGAQPRQTYFDGCTTSFMLSTGVSSLYIRSGKEPLARFELFERVKHFRRHDTEISKW
jgi:hypothetical protein